MDNQSQITAVYQNVEDVGKNIKGSKKRFTWVFQIDGKVYNFVLDSSMISGKIKLACNNNILAMTQDQPLGTFQHTMALGGCQVTLLPISIDSYELRINNKVFSHMLNNQKTKQQFIRNNQACQDFVLDQKLTSTNDSTTGLKKTIRLKIGSMKAKSNNPTKSIQSDDWSKMVNGQETTFPSYFESQNCGNSKQQQVDFSKVSMKKKSQAASQSQQQMKNINLLEDQAQVIEITPEQFSTMQQLFRTQAVSMQAQQSSQNAEINPQTTSSPRNQGPLTGINMNDFTTMQMLFQTQYFTPVNNNSSKTQETTQNSQQNEQPVQISINLQDFNTMQMMFSTMNLGGKSLFQTKKQQLSSHNADQLLSSIIQPSTQPQSQPPKSLDSFDMNDFNTMQKMFATNNLNPMIFAENFTTPSIVTHNQTQKISLETNTEVKCESPQQLPFSQPNSLDFGTMANLFKTMSYNQPQFNNIQSQPQSSTASSNPLDDLMMFSQSPLQTSQHSEQQTLTPANGLSNSSNNMNIGNFNMNDFSTMQMLFKTNSGFDPSINANLFATTSGVSGMQKTSNSSELKENAFQF